MKKFNRIGLQTSAAFVAGYLLSAEAAHAAATSTFSTIGSNVTASMATLPGFLSAVAYMFGILIGVLGVLKIKDHVENPNNAPLKDGAIRLAAGGGLFALPVIYQSMKGSIDGGGAGTVQAAALNPVTLN